MRSFGAIAGLILAVGAGYVVLQRSIDTMPAGAAPQEQVDTVAVQQTLLRVGQAERQYLVAHGVYGTLDQLAADDLLPGGTLVHGYQLTATTSGGDRFAITATPADPIKHGWPTLEVTEAMQVARR